jgi:hypothetical protein
LLKDVEIAYWEIGEVQVNGKVVRESYEDEPERYLNARETLKT